MQLSDQDRLNFILNELKMGPQALADSLQLPVHKIKSIKIGKVKISSEIALLIEQKFNFNFKWIMTGHGDPRDGVIGYPVISLDDNCIKEHSTKYATGALSHELIIKKFKQRDLAKDINWKLLKLENIDPQELNEIGDFIEYRTLKAIERRQRKENINPIQSDDDRRSGQDRRKSGL